MTNYELHKGLWSGHNDHNYFEIAHTMRRLQGLCHDTRLYLFSDNHDVERLPNKLRNREHIRHIAILVYTLWGIPSIYYGSEFGIEGKRVGKRLAAAPAWNFPTSRTLRPPTLSPACMPHWAD